MQLRRSDYECWQGDFYEKQRTSANPLRSWFHNDRYKKIRQLVLAAYSEGMNVFDFGCGTCEWNDPPIPVTGVDFSEPMLNRALEKGTIVKKIISDIRKVPIKGASADIVVCSEVLEHFERPGEVLSEISRIMKQGGKLVCSVPYDTNASLWKPLFAAQCFIQGNLFGDALYRKEGGHVFHFSPDSLKTMVCGYGFAPESIYDNFRFTIFLSATKK